MTPQEAEIHQVLDGWIRAFCAKDLPRMLADYDPTIVIFDVKPPFQTRGLDAVQRLWSEALPCFPEHFEYQRRDVRLIVGSDVAVAHWLFHLAGWPAEHPVSKLWMRATVVLHRQDGRWRSVHEHVSVPFDPTTGMAVFEPGS